MWFIFSVFKVVASGFESVIEKKCSFMENIVAQMCLHSLLTVRNQQVKMCSRVDSCQQLFCFVQRNNYMVTEKRKGFIMKRYSKLYLQYDL